MAYCSSARACSTFCPRPPLSVLAMVLRAERVACACGCVGTSSEAAPPVPTTFIDGRSRVLPFVAPCGTAWLTRHGQNEIASIGTT